MRILYMANTGKDPSCWIEPFVAGLKELGELEIVENCGQWTASAVLEKMRQADVVLGNWGGIPLPEALATDPGRLRYFCYLDGSVRPFVSVAHIEAGIVVSNWGDVVANIVAEGAVTLLLATLKDMHVLIQRVRNGEGGLKNDAYGGTLEGLNVGMYGFGVIGRRFAELIQVFRPVIRCYDPFAKEYPAYVTPVGSLKELFGQSEAIAVHAGLNDQTRGSVTRELLAMLPRHGVFINTARGDIVDQEALFDELRSGRLRAGLDVLAKNDWLEPGDPMRKQETLIWSCHGVGRGWPTDGEIPTKLSPKQKICLDNLRRFRDGLPLKFTMDRERYRLST